MAAGVLAASATAWTVQDLGRTVHSISRVPLGTVLDTVPQSDADVAPSTYLVVGADGVDGERTDEADGPRAVLADTIMIVRTDPANAAAEVLPLPRDLWVWIPDHGRRKINAAMSLGAEDDPIAGGEKLLIETIRENFGIAINHYVEIDFAGFTKLVDKIGGLDFYLPAPARDKNMGAWPQGCQHLDGDQALHFSRSRKYQAEVDGSWRSDPGGDLGRIRRQQFIIRLIISKAIRQGASNPIQLRSLVNASAKDLTLDDTLSVKDLVDLAMKYRELNLQDIVTNDLTVTFETRGNADVDVLDDTRANREILAPFQTAGVGGDHLLLEPLATVGTSTSTSVTSTTTAPGGTTADGSTTTTTAKKGSTTTTTTPSTPETDPNYWFTPQMTQPNGQAC